MLDSSSSRTMSLDYLVMDSHLIVDDFELIDKYEDYYHYGRCLHEIFMKKIEEQMNFIDAFARIIDMVLSCPSYKRLSSSKSSHPSSSKLYRDSSRYHLHSSSSKSSSSTRSYSSSLQTCFSSTSAKSPIP